MEKDGYMIFDNNISMEGKMKSIKPKSHSITAMNLETIEDVDKVIHQCELLKEEMTNELSDNLNIRQYIEVPYINFYKLNEQYVCEDVKDIVNTLNKATKYVGEINITEIKEDCVYFSWQDYHFRVNNYLSVEESEGIILSSSDAAAWVGYILKRIWIKIKNHETI